jgi:hypothetical protein
MNRMIQHKIRTVVRFEILIVMFIQGVVFWVVTLCSSVVG